MHCRCCSIRRCFIQQVANTV